MGDADRRAVASGIRSSLLMERAGEAVAAAAAQMVPAGGRIAVLAGPGNNGGDGFVAARLLAESGYRVSVFLVGDRDALKGDASLAARAWTGAGRGSEPRFRLWRRPHHRRACSARGSIDRSKGSAPRLSTGRTRAALPILAVDLPSGVDGASGAILGRAILAQGDGYLLPTQTRVICSCQGGFSPVPSPLADIGHDAAILSAIRPTAFHNNPALWLEVFPRPRLDGHKYDRGHTLVVSGPLTGTGAARLAARGALRIGSGLVTVASPPDAVVANAAHLTAIMLMRMYEAEGLAEILADHRKNAVVIGPALGCRRRRNCTGFDRSQTRMRRWLSMPMG